ncbi:SH2B adapter protein 3 isoform X2 [Emydura macquarii macquarii]|uniref:SH2B adapter protein 3 isoform X2 n=1 Tax=Emydura macquarii macquarii TaxID=1129001 RepID=UPI00352AC0A2
MNGQAIPAGTARRPQGWHEFCELHAITTAKELARKYLLFAAENPHHDLLAAENFSVQFTDLFQQYFCNEVKEGFAMNPCRALPVSRVRDYRETSRRCGDASSGTVAAKAELTARPDQADRASDTNPRGLPKSWSSEELMGAASPLAARRHFSLTQLRRSWHKFFRRRSSEAMPGEGEALEPALKPGLAKKILPWTLSRDQAPEVCKEGLLKYSMVDEATLDSGTRWQRCRLVLRKTGTSDSEEYVLELFDPPKGSRPKLLTTCSAVQEIRRCTRLEMPDNLNTFVLKVNNCTDIIFEATDEQQLSSWTAEIKACVTHGSEGTDVELLSGQHSDTVGSPATSSTDSLPQAPAALPDGAGAVPRAAPALPLHRGHAAPLPALPHPAGVRHGLRRQALQLRGGHPSFARSRLKQCHLAPVLHPYLELRTQPVPRQLPPHTRGRRPQFSGRADLPPCAALRRTGQQPSPQRCSPRLRLRAGFPGPGPHPGY